ncbi:hypothetical protein LSTR_LSTR002730 [Laodelphax striatellus]|uniref:m7GpppX diphosphatase n=1 Tax=Laodelphax striatellus TaxID=195883 RepID=A0A482X6H6_LAOST|nr:hypothetical protein LSTR_LSTR002730 [Laodelphax striatellus]
MEKDKNVVADACSDKDGSSNENTSISFTDLSTFVLKRILSENSQKKTIIAEGSFSDQEGTAILFLEKTPFNEELLKCLCSTESTLEEQLCNDIYRFYTCNPELKYGGFKATIIFPATEKHVKKYEIQPLHLIEETSKLYYEVTLPHITSESFNIQWVYNILTHQQEQESIVFEDPDPNLGFVLVPDLKWDKNQVSNLYLLAIIHRHNIKSLRDLTDEHLPLLKNIQEKGSLLSDSTFYLANLVSCDMFCQEE